MQHNDIVTINFPDDSDYHGHKARVDVMLCGQASVEMLTGPKSGNGKTYLFWNENLRPAMAEATL